MIERTEVRGWDVLTLRSDELAVSVVPGKGGDITSVRWLPRDLELLWQSPWGLRQRGAAPTAGTSHVRFLEQWPGGWQTMFPHAGAAADRGGVEQPFHGEATLAWWDVVEVDERDGASAVVLETRLTRSPFGLRRRISVEGASVVVEEQAVNEGAVAFDAAWSHHPAFGGPLVSPDCRIRTSARRVVTDPHVVPPLTDAPAGIEAAWPMAGDADLSRLPAAGAGVNRMAYLHDFPGQVAEAVLENRAAGVEATLSWDTTSHPWAWLWLESGGTTGYPFYGAAYVLAIEPASGWEGSPPLTFEAGQTRSARIELSVRPC